MALAVPQFFADWRNVEDNRLISGQDGPTKLKKGGIGFIYQQSQQRIPVAAAVAKFRNNLIITDPLSNKIRQLRCHGLAHFSVQAFVSSILAQQQQAS
jgi:hypothetical protein